MTLFSVVIPPESPAKYTLVSNMAQDILSLRVTQEQRELIYAMWAHNDWNVELIETECSQCSSSQNGSLENEGNFLINPINGENECVHCLCSPCVTDPHNKQLWWEDNMTPPHISNASKRKGLYKRFWVMLLHRNAWKDPRYMRIKSEALVGRREGDSRDSVCVWSGPGRHRRDIMPLCVLKTVRGWLPNLPSKPYMGHRWE